MPYKTHSLDPISSQIILQQLNIYTNNLQPNDKTQTEIKPKKMNKGCNINLLGVKDMTNGELKHQVNVVFMACLYQEGREKTFIP